ncbi:MAG: glycosyltransferase, exosortase A system-associated [Methylomonas sp.]|jgi:PEP-CTERM/exosortase A-associated glycosyltransferase|uniref:TIGR04063 family PEP-CTERM/XrtA system glycosyltransferase n=1 Tax=Methylomonas sp. TaxID=418 RepID=UPI0025D0A711|nr:TIGR04063 family PEP-CTERM/XrtA system glycosyltransferase [Methylomonas sp.]MCK9605992.1 glycosyltransferase, exosortase A system-associated [Methylomonas sp.]
MKVLHILDHSIPLHSGYTFRTQAILDEQRKLGWETFHITSAKHVGGRSAVETVDGFDFYRSPDPEGVFANFSAVNQWAIVKSLEKRLDEIIPRIKPDVLHAHSPALNGLAALGMSKKYHIPLVYECRAFWEDAAVNHGTTNEGSLRYRISKALETHVLKRADAITTICEGLRSDIISRGVKADNVTVIPNAVDIDKFTRRDSPDLELTQELDLVGKQVLGFIGSFYAYEGLLLLLDALSAIIRSQPNVRVLLVGNGPQRRQLTDKIKALDLQAFVSIIGRVPHDQVQRYYNVIDILIYPSFSTRSTELSAPLKPLEAMAMGCIVVASEVGGHREYIRDHETGYLFKAGDKESLVQTVLMAINDKGVWDGIRKSARLYVKDERSWLKVVSKYQSVYGKLVKL